jgi:hypothetical protein
MTPSEHGAPDDVSALRREVEVLRLDQEWEQQRRALGAGDGTRPSKLFALFPLLGGMAMAAFGFIAAFYLIPRSSGPQNNTVPIIIAVGALVAGFISTVWLLVKAERYEKALRQYERHRKSLLDAENARRIEDRFRQ